MNKINVVSEDTALSRIIELEAGRLGMNAVCSPAPLEGYSLYLIDQDTEQSAEIPAEATVILLSDESREESATELSARASAHLTKPLLLRELRWVLTHLSSAPQQPIYFPEHVVAKHFRKRRESTPLRLIIDHQQKSASLSGGAPIRLSETEYRLLCLLYDNKNQPVSAEMAAPILGETGSNKFNVYICYLRKKLEHGTLRLILTVRGKGYMLRIK